MLVWYLRGDPARGQGTRIHRTAHGVTGPEHPDPRTAVAGCLRGDDLGYVQTGHRQG